MQLGQILWHLICRACNVMDCFMSHLVLTPGMFVRHPQHPEWGIGQVQSRVGVIVTVTFADAGKKVINASSVALVLVPDSDL